MIYIWAVDELCSIWIAPLISGYVCERFLDSFGSSVNFGDEIPIRRGGCNGRGF